MYARMIDLSGFYLRCHFKTLAIFDSMSGYWSLYKYVSYLRSMALHFLIERLV